MSVSISPKVQQQVDIIKKLQAWKDQHGDRAKFVSRDGFPFNCFNDSWLLNGEGENGQQLTIGFFHTKDWSDELQCHIRFALAALAKTRSANTLRNDIRTALNTLPLSALSKPEIEGVWPIMLDYQRKSLKILLNQLIKINNTLYNDACNWVEDNYVKPHSKSNPYDIEKGSLSEFEVQSFERELSRYIKEKLYKLNENIDNFESQLVKLDTVKNLIMLRLMYALVRRSCNLNQAKWSDILPVGASFIDEKNKTQGDMTTLDFSDEDELQVRVWKAKNQSGFRQSVERYSLRLNAKLTQEVLTYRLAYRRCLQFCLSNSNIEVTKEELDVLMMRSPLAYISSFFQKEFATKEEVFNALSEKGSGFHVASSSITDAITKKVAPKLDLKSDRVPNMTVGNNRFRHTVGTMAAIMGQDIAQIANLLGNTITAARTYIDMSDEQRANLDNKYIANNKLAQIFEVNIATLQKDERYTISDSEGNEAGQAKNRQSCFSCDEVKRPLACYGCNNFQALENGDHRKIRDDAQRIYDKRISDGDPSYLLGKLATHIRWVNITIAVCDEKIAIRSALNAQ